MNRTRPSILDVLFSLFIGSVVSIPVALCSGLVSGLFTSQHYTNQHAINLMIAGLVIGYSVAFSAFAWFLLFLGRATASWFPATGLATALMTCFWRSLGALLPSLDCGNSCVDTQLPLSAEQRASLLIYLSITAIYALFVAIYVRHFRQPSENNVAKPTQSV